MKLTEEGKGAKYSGVIYRSATFEIILLNKRFLVALTSEVTILVTAAGGLIERACCCPEVCTTRLLHVVEFCPLDGDRVVMPMLLMFVVLSRCESLLPALLAEAVCFSSSNIVICFVTFVTFMDVTWRSVGCRLELQALLLLLTH